MVNFFLNHDPWAHAQVPALHSNDVVSFYRVVSVLRCSAAKSAFQCRVTFFFFHFLLFVKRNCVHHARTPAGEKRPLPARAMHTAYQISGKGPQQIPKRASRCAHGSQCRTGTGQKNEEIEP